MTENRTKNGLKGQEIVNQSADIRAMLNDFGVSATLTDMSASTSTTVSGYSSPASHTGIG